MSEFYKRFLTEDGRRLDPKSGRFLALGVFGKHPGWDDHIEDLGLDTESLNLAKRILYVQGIGGQIDRGAWEQLKEEQRLNAFDHLFVWQRADQLLIGRMWSSSDGKGRTRYPMIICAHGIGASLAWALATVLPKLAEVQAACQSVRTAEEVRSIISSAREELRRAIAAEGAGATVNAAPAALSQFVASAEFGPDREGLLRILYSMLTHAAVFAPGRFSLKGDLSGLRALQIRVPATAQPVPQVLPVWQRLFDVYTDRIVPRLMIWPASAEWMDVTFGEPSPHEFFCIRAGSAAVPLTTQVPYELDTAFRQLAGQQVAEFATGREVKAVVASPSPATVNAAPREANGATRSWLKTFGEKFWLKVGGVVLLLLLVAVAVVILTARPPVADQPSDHPGVSRTVQESGSVPAKPPSEAASVPATKDVTVPAKPATKTAKEASPPAEAGRESSRPQENAEAKRRAAEVEEAKRLAAEQARRDAAARLEAEERARKAAAEAEAARVAAARRVAEEKQRAEAEAKPGVTPPPAADSPAPAAAAASSAAESQSILTNSIGMVLLWVAGLPDAGKGAWVCKYEITQEQYEKVAGANPSQFRAARRPVDSVTWDQAVAFCDKLTAAEKGRGKVPSGYSYALPSQRQWDFFLGNANFENSVTSRGASVSRTETAEVGSQRANQFGLHDVLGNVWEWCADAGAGGQRILKGDAFNSKGLTPTAPSRTVSPTTAYLVMADAKQKYIGFRCILSSKP